MEEEIIQKLNLAAERTMKGNHDWSMRLDTWDWNQGVGMYGLYKAFEALKREDILEFLTAWTKRYAGEIYKTPTINSMAPVLMVLELFHKTGEEYYYKICEDAAKWLKNEAKRTCDGGFEHTVTEAVEFGNQMWADTLFMSCIFLARFAAVSGDDGYLDIAVNQLKLHHNYLKDSGTGLFYHGWDGNRRNHMSAVLWGRANAWITIATVEILSVIKKDLPDIPVIKRSLLEQLDAIMKLQRLNGAFGTVLNLREAYDETSVTAGIAYGIKKGVEAGIIEKKFEAAGKAAFAYVLSQINNNGEAEGVSGGTPVMPSSKDYLEIPCYPSLYGQGLTLLMLSSYFLPGGEKGDAH